MMSLFTPESPLGLEVQKILLEQREGLTVAQIRRELRFRIHKIEEHNLRELLNHPRVFTALPGDKYCLHGQVSAATAPKLTTPKPKNITQQPFLADLGQARRDYIVIDLETTGLEPKRDKIIQLVAIRYRAGQPEAALCFYFNPAHIKLPYTLKLKLGLDKHPEVESQINQGQKFEQAIPEIRAFIGDLPLVAHNACFEQQFLQNNLGDLPNSFIDTMELATLLYPALPNHRLDTVATAAGVNYQQAAQIWQEASGAPSPFEISADSLHNAITDTALLAALYSRLLENLDSSTNHAQPVLRRLLPELFGEATAVGQADSRKYFAAGCAPVVKNSESPAIYPDSEPAADLLEQYRQGRGFPRRPGQEEMANYVAEALHEGHFKLIEAPTGTGKTIAYLIPAVVKAAQSGERVVISTAYRNLQDQLLAEVEELKKLTNFPFQHQILKGVSNYICNERLLSYIEELDGEAELAERYVLAYLFLRLLAVPKTTIDDLSYWLTSTFKVASHVYRAVSAANGGCNIGRCGPFGCALLQASEGAKAAHLLVINHDLWLADPDRLPPFRHLVLDEAHNLEDIATRAFTKEVSRASLDELFDNLEDRQTGRGALPRLRAQTSDLEVARLTNQGFAALRMCRNLVAEFGTHLAHYIKIFEGKLNPRYGAALRLESDPRLAQPVQWEQVERARKQLFDIHLTDLSQSIGSLLRAITPLQNLAYKERSQEELQAVWDSLLEHYQLQAEIVKVNNQKKVYWLEVAQAVKEEKEGRETFRYGEWAMKSAPVRVDPELQNFYQKLDALVLVSATLTIRGGEFDFFVDRLGLQSWLGQNDLHIVKGDLDYNQNAFLGLANYLEYTPVERTMQSFIEEFAKELQLLLDFTGGRSLVLFTARERMEEAVKRCEAILAQKGIPLYWQEPEASRRRLQEDFRDRVESVLMGLQSFWEGVDVPGESLSFVIMEKLPFPFLFEPIFKARREEVLQRNQHEFNDFIFPLMAIKFKQGFGRLLRKKDDRGAVILLDKRLHRKSYKFELLASLPGYIPRQEQIERSRRAFYEAIVNTFPGLIDLANKQSLLDCLPEELALDFEERLKAYQLPDLISEADYPQWRVVLLQAMKDIFRFSDFRSPEQEAAIKAILTGQDVLALLPTGAGKSLCFQLPALLRKGLTLVISPLIALMRDQVQALNGRGIEVVGAIYSGQPADEREEILGRLRSGRVKLVYVSPERLRDPQLIYALAGADVRQVVVDEAHCVAMWGPSFRPDFLYLPRLFQELKSRLPLAAFTATATLPIRQEIILALQMKAVTQVVASFDRPELRFVVYNQHSKYNPITSKNKRFAALMKILQAADRERDSVLVYVTTTVEAETLARRLRQAGYDARPYHGKMKTAERDSVQELFMEDQVNIVVCTKAFGMGIDKPNIRYVIHYNTPGDLESYYQEAGRAGRDGKESYCILLHHYADRNTHDYFIESGLADPESLNQLLGQLRHTSAEKIYFDPENVTDRLNLDEVQLKVSLHLLEKAGFIRRGADFTLHGSLTLLTDLSEIASQLEPAEATLFNQLAIRLNLPVYRRLEINLLEAAQLVGQEPEVIDGLFIKLATLSLALYRPWEKGYLLSKTPRLLAGENYTPEDSTQGVSQQLKLDTMFNYAQAHTSSKGSQCRRAFILNYFGETAKTKNCGGCDLCQPDYPFPWSNLTARDVGEFADMFDPAFTLLEVVKWSIARTKQGHNPYSKGTLLNVLRGNSHQLGKFVTDPALRRWRLQQFRNCPYWGIFESLAKADEIIEKSLNRLLSEEFLQEITASFGSGIETRSYSYLDLLPKGRDQLLRGELLRWKVE